MERVKSNKLIFDPDFGFTQFLWAQVDVKLRCKKRGAHCWYTRGESAFRLMKDIHLFQDELRAPTYLVTAAKLKFITSQQRKKRHTQTV